MKRRDFIKLATVSGLTLTTQTRETLSVADTTTAFPINIDPKPKFDLSPWLYMQFMEPLGVTDSSVEASWDHGRQRWKPELVDVTRELAPGMIRWGGLLSAYYRWKEAVGPRDQRKPMYNICWGGIETNQVGTAEFVDFCKRVGSDPLMCVNFESEGDPAFLKTPMGDDRCGNAQEAAEWVDYCNNPDNPLRKVHGFADPLRIDVWQLGNETSYGNKRFDRDTAVRKTIEFADAMRKVDPGIKLIAWGENDRAEAMIKNAGDKIDYIAFHHMFDPGAPIRDNDYRNDPAKTWDILINAYKIHERKIDRMREQVAPYQVPLALTECHLAVPGRNRCEVLSSWAAGCCYARMANLHERHGDLLKIATLADFCGTRWQVNAIMIPVPNGHPYLMPVAKVMALYRKYSGRQFLQTTSASDLLDVTGSRSGDTFYLHIVNTSRTHSVSAEFRIDGMKIVSAKAYEISENPMYEIIRAENDRLQPKEKIIDLAKGYSVPPASVTAVELMTTAIPTR
jgi:alpha-L-arabinofuranosidase